MTTSPLDADSAAATVLAAAHAYDQALVDGDGQAAAAFFSDDATVSRFGPDGEQFGPEAVRALRTGYAAVAEPVWLHDDVTMVSATVAIHKAVIQRGGATLQRTQVWSSDVGGGGWAIVHAHVSRLAQP